MVDKSGGIGGKAWLQRGSLKKFFGGNGTVLYLSYGGEYTSACIFKIHEMLQYEWILLNIKLFLIKKNSRPEVLVLPSVRTMGLD